MTQPTTITIAHGDGIGPEIMKATLDILSAAGAHIKTETIEIGEGVYRRGHVTGIEPSSWDTLRRNKVFLKAPITTPQGGGFKSLNVTIRKAFGLYANVRPCVSYHPFVKTNHPKMDLVIVRENEEDLYAGIEYRQSDEMMQCLKLISRPGSEKIIRYAFDYARANNRKKVTCMSKDNIMKMTDGLFHKIFDEVAKEYPDIQNDHMIIDIGSARIADKPERFDVIVTTNLYGDIISDIAAEVAGSVGLAGSVNLGDHIAMFEAIHGSAPDIAGQDLANPSGLLLGAVMMLVHIGQGDVAEKIHNAWLKTIEDGIHTGDVASADFTKQKVGTKAFAAAVIERLGQKPKSFAPVSYKTGEAAKYQPPKLTTHAPAKKTLSGVDVYFHISGLTPTDLAEKIKAALPGDLDLRMLSNRGVSVWPELLPETFLTDHWRARILGTMGHNSVIPHASIAELLKSLSAAGLDFIKTENLYLFDGKPGWSLDKGE